MLKIIKRLPFLQTSLAVLFLLMQVSTSLFLPYMTRDIVNHGIMPGDIDHIWSMGTIMISIAIFGLICAVFSGLIFSRISYQLGGQLRSDIYRKAMSFSKYEFDKIGTSSLITRNTNDISQVQMLIEITLKFLLMAPIMLIGSIVMTFILDQMLSLIFIVLVPLIFTGYFVIYQFAGPLYLKMQKNLDRLNLYFREGLTGVRVIRAFNKDTSEYEKYTSVSREYTRTSITAGTIMCFFAPAITLLINLATLGAVWIAGHKIQNNTMQLGDITALIGYAAQILVAITVVTMVITSIPRGQTSARRINEVLDMPLTISDPSHALEPKEINLKFEHVNFRYHGASRRTLSDISFSVSAGQTLAIIGSTGDGKSSIINLITRMYDVESGSVIVNGVNVMEMKEETLHSLVSLVPQKSTLFFGTIRSNMQIGKPGATDEEIWLALKMAQAEYFVKALDKGLDSIVEKAGGNFSGGQKQRLCIARALVKDADIYIFDDSYSALDFKTDLAIRKAIGQYLKRAITIIITQRISSAMSADKIAVMDKGTLSAIGLHNELIKSNDVYKAISHSQFNNQGDAL